MRYRLLTWDECYRQSKEVAAKIRRSGFYPEVIVALARSGFVPGRVFSDLLSVDELFGLQVHHVMGGGLTETGTIDVETEYEAVIPFKAPLNIRGDSALVVDDIVGTGKSMTTAVQFLQSLGPKALKVATLGYSTESIIRPDFYSLTVGEDDWILYPWNYFEDFEGLITKAKKKLKVHEASPDVLAKVIREEFGVSISLDELKYVIDETKQPRPARKPK